MPPIPDPGGKERGTLWQWALQAIGGASVALAVLGLFLPVLPTVPFLLLAAACFARGSDRCYTWLVEHEQLGPLVRPYLDGKGLPLKTKIKAILMVWASIAISAIFLVDLLWVRILLPIIALGVTLYLLRLPTAETDAD
ncbi:YbaN family protein [Trichloromonas sp.]|uniref:YbaN family protein n=1 Tax=Trichloromonas sp. TaxID=3069249 RepID=UPI002A3DD5E3|nr:YbaN family protein [Trichloromonas sp.]